VPTWKVKGEVESVKKELDAQKLKQKKYYDKTAKDLKPLKDGDVIRMAFDGGWRKAQVLKKLDRRTYRVRTEDGRVFRRNRRHMKDMKHEEFTPEPPNLAMDDAPDVVAAELPVEQIPDEPPEPVRTTRAGRVIRRPQYLQDYQLS
jgi:hypothetical protein